MDDDDRGTDEATVDRDLEGLTFKVVVVESIVAVVLVLALIFGWTLEDVPVLDLTTDPAGNLPF